MSPSAVCYVFFLQLVRHEVAVGEAALANVENLKVKCGRNGHLSKSYSKQPGDRG